MTNFFEEAYQDAMGIWRWKSNDRVPFDDMLEDNGIDVETRGNCAIARTKEQMEFLQEYIDNPPPVTDEELYEMRAAFGKGETVVNVITGKRIKL